MSEIKLPPLPAAHAEDDFRWPVYDESQMLDFARAAVELNRPQVPEDAKLDGLIKRLKQYRGERVCPAHPEHGERLWWECEQCDGTGIFGHDCGEDCCVCLYPEDNERCNLCDGHGGWWRCFTCAPELDD